MGFFIDTGFLLYLENEEDKNFSEVRNWMKGFLKDEFGMIHTFSYLFDEIVILVLVGLKRTDFAINVGNYILFSPRINLREVISKN